MSPRAYDRLKRAADVLLSGALLILTAPLVAGVAVVVRRDLGSPVLFRQRRPGLHGQPFELIKFRTMRDGAEADGARLTPMGRRLRSTSLDELPTLWNVLRGDMSLVGPRPLMLGYLALYTPRQARRHEVRPGITGLAQVSGRNAVPWDERFALDLDYIDRRSARLDADILARTIVEVIRRHGISGPGSDTMRAFTGSAAG